MATNSDLKPVRVEITVDKKLGGEISVNPIWPGVDRPNTGGYLLKAKDGKLAKRLAAAYMSGAAYGEVKIVVDINGKTFVSASSLIRGRCINADLKAIGY